MNLRPLIPELYANIINNQSKRMCACVCVWKKNRKNFTIFVTDEVIVLQNISKIYLLIEFKWGTAIHFIGNFNRYDDGDDNFDMR